VSAIGVRAADTPAGPTMFGHFARTNEWTTIDSWAEGGRCLERFSRGAFERTLRDKPPKVLFQHGHDPQIGNKPLGRPSLLREDDEGAFYEVPLYPSVPDLIVDGLRGGAYGASFRFSVAHEELVQRPGVSAHNPEGIPERTVMDATVAEFSPVTFPAYEGATANVRSLAEEIGYESRDGLRDPTAVLAILKGTRMVTPVRTINFAGETLRPGISRLVVAKITKPTGNPSRNPPAPPIKSPKIEKVKLPKR
jgi:phage head maturation protease